jgi:hypothetical protein
VRLRACVCACVRACGLWTRQAKWWTFTNKDREVDGQVLYLRATREREW